jgi:hypothetical protein
MDGAGEQKIYICDHTGILAKIPVDGTNESEELFCTTIEGLLK